MRHEILAKMIDAINLNTSLPKIRLDPYGEFLHPRQTHQNEYPLLEEPIIPLNFFPAPIDQVWYSSNPVDHYKRNALSGALSETSPASSWFVDLLRVIIANDLKTSKWQKAWDCRDKIHCPEIYQIKGYHDE